MIKYIDDICVKDYNFLRKSVGWKMLEEKQAQTGLNQSQLLVAAFDNDEPVATARVVGDGGYMFLIADVMVRPDYQRRGIGRNLIQRILAWFDELASDGRCLMVNIMSTKGNEEFYSKLGFTERPNETMGAGLVKWFNA